MLTIEVATGGEAVNERNEFVRLGVVKLEMEHSLLSMSKWESKFEKPFLSTDKTPEQVLEYVQMMTLTPDVPSEVFTALSEKNVREIDDYITAKMTATWFSDSPTRGGSQETITSELVYYWMFSYRIPIECETWHLNRLFTLIKVFSEKSKPPKKMSRSEIARRQQEINAARKAKYNTSG